MRAAISAVLDCSFVAHALFPRQRTPEARQELESLLRARVPLAAPDALFLEYYSLIRKTVNRGQMSSTEAESSIEEVRRLPILIIPLDDHLLARAYELAKLLGQSDVFDAAGYAVAEAYGAEFWTSDRRFANAASAANLAAVRFVV